MANGVMYTFTGLGVIAAIDPGTGKTIWQFDPETWKAGRPTNLGFLHRGLSYWTDGTVERLFAGTHDAYLISVDAKSGKLDPRSARAGASISPNGSPSSNESGITPSPRRRSSCATW